MRKPNSNGGIGDSGAGRDASSGRFVKGNAGGPGSPAARHARQLRERLDHALFIACAPDRLLAAVDSVLKAAEAGDVQALKLLMERIAGPPLARDVIERLEQLEQAMESNSERT